MPLLSGIRSRFAAEVPVVRRRLSGAPVRSAPERTGGTPPHLTDFEVREAMYDGTLYLPSVINGASFGGKRRYVLELLGKPCSAAEEGKYPVPGYFNPAKQITD